MRNGTSIASLVPVPLLLYLLLLHLLLLHLLLLLCVVLLLIHTTIPSWILDHATALYTHLPLLLLHRTKGEQLILSRSATKERRAAQFTSMYILSRIIWCCSIIGSMPSIPIPCPMPIMLGSSSQRPMDSNISCW